MDGGQPDGGLKHISALAQNRLYTPLDYNYFAIKHSKQAPWPRPKYGAVGKEAPGRWGSLRHMNS